MIIRDATERDRVAIRDLYLRTFPEEERDLVGELAVQLLAERSQPATFSLVAEENETVLGHIAFSPVEMAEKGPEGFLLAPLAVDPLHQRGGIGSRLVAEGKERLFHSGVEVILVYGDPAYYERFGFEGDPATHFQPPFALTYPFGWQALLSEGAQVPSPATSLRCVPALMKPELW